MPPSDFAKANIDEIIDKLSTEEAVTLIAGVGRWYTAAIERLSIPAIKVTNGPNGVSGSRFYEGTGTPGKCLPCPTALAATWDRNRIEEIGLGLLASEAKLKAASVILGPTCNTQRNPLGGRSFESFSEDPHLSGTICSAYIRGVQSGGIGTTIKHFVANDKEDERNRYDSVLSERALREIYLMPFMLAQKYAQPWAVMTAYNRVNGAYASENAHLLQDILRREWKFDGLIMSDWFGTYSVGPAINAGLDLEMPGQNKRRTFEQVEKRIAAKQVDVDTVKERAKKVLELVQKCAKETPEVLDSDGQERTADSEEDKALMRKLAGESIVLLKNNGATLPLRARGLKKIAIVGGNAKAQVLSGGGSASLKPSYFTSPYDGIVNALPKGVQVTYSEGARSGAGAQNPEELLESAVEVAKDADAVIAVVGLSAVWESSGYDRTTLDLPGRANELIQRVAGVNPKTIVVTQSGSAITMPWVDTVPAIIHAWYLGNATGDAIADVLFGHVNPSGKLPLTFPRRLEDVPSFEHFNVDNGKVRYAEDIFVGYKHYQHKGIIPTFPFGHGLSYTTFQYSGITVSEPRIRENVIAVTVKFNVRNTGNIAGSEVAQLYISWPSHSTLAHPPLTLKAFSKISLEAGESGAVELRLDKYAVSSWMESSNRWIVERGNYTISVGPSSQELPLTATMTIGSGFEWTGL